MAHVLLHEKISDILNDYNPLLACKFNHSVEAILESLDFAAPEMQPYFMEDYQDKLNFLDMEDSLPMQVKTEINTVLRQYYHNLLC